MRERGRCGITNNMKRCPIQSKSKIVRSLVATTALASMSLARLLPPLYVLQLRAVRDRMSKTTTILASLSDHSCIRILDLLEPGRDALLAFLEQVLEIEQSLGRGLFVHEGGGDTGVAGSSGTTNCQFNDKSANSDHVMLLCDRYTHSDGRSPRSPWAMCS